MKRQQPNNPENLTDAISRSTIEPADMNLLSVPSKPVEEVKINGPRFGLRHVLIAGASALALIGAVKGGPGLYDRVQPSVPAETVDAHQKSDLQTVQESVARQTIENASQPGAEQQVTQDPALLVQQQDSTTQRFKVGE